MAANPAELNGEEVIGATTVRRISWLICTLGLAASLVVAAVSRKWDWAIGIAIGTGLAWLNFRLLQRGAKAFLQSAGRQQHGQSARGPVPAYLGMILRYSLIGLSIYAIFRFLHVPLASLVAGLCALGAAMVVGSVWALVKPE